MTHVNFETKISCGVINSPMHLCPGNCVVIGCAFVYDVPTARAFSVGINVGTVLHLS